MKIIIPQKDLMGALNRVRSVVENKSTIPVLGFLKFESEGDGVLGVSGTDMDIQVKVKVPAAVDQGSALIEGSKINEFVRRIPADRDIVIEADEEFATIKAKRSRAKLSTLPVGDFPKARTGIAGAPFTLTSDDVHHVLAGPLPAVSDEEIRYYLCGVFMHIDDGKLIGAATDGHHLIKTCVDAPPGCSLESGVIVPTKAINVLQKCLDDEDVSVAVDDGAIRFSTSSFDIQSRLVNGTFPDYQRVIPSERDHPVSVHRKEAIGVVARIASIAPEEFRSVLLEHDDGGIAVKLPQRSGVEADDIIFAETNGEFPFVAFSAKRMEELLAAMQSERVTFHFNDAGAPHVFIDNDRPDDIHILMPMRERA